MFETIDLQIKDAQTEIKKYIKNNYEYLEKIKLHYLRSLVLLIVSEYEIIIEKIFILRAMACKDTMLINYIKNQMDKKFRSPDLSKIIDILGKFDDTLKISFKQKIIDTPLHNRWDNLLKARHCIVHQQGSLNITYDELILSYKETKKIIFELITLLNTDKNNLHKMVGQNSA
jgi:hypothetical protein